ncbi:uncharacterized protein [Anabrus simplex]|uniref:uncharacterized protein n=1 Tax=Anabrus simplex TaxID=316456 RepID=UPI0035A315F5
MDLFNSEFSECLSPSSEDSSEESDSSWAFTHSSVQSSDSSPLLVKFPKITRKSRHADFLKKLYMREIGGCYKKKANDVTKPALQRVKLKDILPVTASELNHVFLGLSKCGQFLLSYTITTELDVIPLNTLYKYRLHWWSFSPPQKSRKVSEVMLFGNQSIYSMLYIAVCQWPMDYNHVLIYGNCFETYVGSSTQAERSYLTITTVPSLNKCQDCSVVAASYEEEDLAANWDTCVRFSCLKHSLTVHSTFDVVSPYPKFEPSVSMKRDGMVVFNTGNQLHVLSVELEHVNNSNSTSATAPDPSENIEEPSNNDIVFQIKQEVDFNNGGQEHWLDDVKPLAKDVFDNIPQNSCLCNIRSRSVSPSLSCVIGDKIGANVSYVKTGMTNSTSERTIDKSKFEDEDDGDEDSVPFKDVIESKKLLSRYNMRFVSSDGRTTYGFNCDKCGKCYYLQSDDKDSDKRMGYSELEILEKSMKERIAEEAHSGRVTRLQTTRERLELSTDGSFDEDYEEESCRPLKRQLRLMDERLWGRDGHVMDSTQELNISCGVMNSGLEGSQSNVTLMSPVQKPLLVVSTDEIKNEENHTSGRRRGLSPLRLKRSRCGTAVKLSSPLPPSSVTTRWHSKMAAEAEKAYEFTEDLPETACEKLSSYRRRRLADKKYEFCEEGEDAENIVPYRLHRRRESIRLRSPPVNIPPSPVVPSHRRRRQESDSSDAFSGPRSPSTSSYSTLGSDIQSISLSCGHPETDKVVLRPLNQNMSATLLLSPRDRDPVSSDRSSPPVYIPQSPLIRRRLHEPDSSDVVCGPRSPTTSTYNTLSTDIQPLPQSAAACVDPDKVVLRPVSQNLSASDRSKTILNRKASQPEMVSVSEDASLPVIGDAVVEEAATTGGDAADSNTQASSAGRCTVQVKRRFLEVDDELISVITDIEDDDLNECTGYHCALPLEVHGAGYVQLQMISNSKAEKLMAPCVLVMQRSFDIEQFCHNIAERLCEESGKKYWFCNDYDVEIVDVCPFSGDVIALAMMRIQATVKTKGLAKSQRHPVSSQQRRQYQGGCRFVWNLDTGLYSVVDTKELTEVEEYIDEKEPWNPAREMAREMRENLPHIPLSHMVRYICNKPALRGVSATRLEDLGNMIELQL